jgi:dolichol-phosphate mannosyltransferase
MRTLVVLPTYNEADNIVEVIDRVRAAADVDILVVDDGSPDGTGDVVDGHAAALGDGRVRLMRRAGKQGLGTAYLAGFADGLAHDADVLVEMDSDLQHDPAALPSLLAAVAHGADLAIGSRYVPGGSIPHWAWHRQQLSKWGNRYAGAVLGLAVRDATSGYRAYRASALAAIDLHAVRADGYAFQIELAYTVARNGGNVVEVPIQFHERQRGQSNMSGGIVVEALLLVTRWAIRDRLLGRITGRHRPRRRSGTLS